jgi:hypothetical protein
MLATYQIMQIYLLINTLLHKLIANYLYDYV